MIFLVLIGGSGQTSCNKKNFCLACSSTHTDQCDACHNFSHGQIEAKGLDVSVVPNNCRKKFPAALVVQSCKWYSGLEKTTDTVHTVNTCQICTTDILNFDESTRKASCTGSLGVIDPSCKAILNCETTVCYKDLAGDSSHGCRMCKANWSGSNYDTIHNTGSLMCNHTPVIKNCQFSIQDSKYSHTCYGCLWDYAVTLAGKGCASYTFDIGCRRLGEAETTSKTSTALGKERIIYCQWCWHAYYWNGLQCKLQST